MSPDEIFASQMWTWPDPMLKRDAAGRVIVVNAAFLQLYGGQATDWTGNPVTGWPAPQAAGTSSRFDTRIPNADGSETVYDWLEFTLQDGSALALARDVTTFTSVQPAPQVAPAPPAAVETAAQPPVAVPAYEAPVETPPVMHAPAEPAAPPMADPAAAPYAAQPPYQAEAPAAPAPEAPAAQIPPAANAYQPPAEPQPAAPAYAPSSPPEIPAQNYAPAPSAAPTPPPVQPEMTPMGAIPASPAQVPPAQMPTPAMPVAEQVQMPEPSLPPQASPSAPQAIPPAMPTAQAPLPQAGAPAMPGIHEAADNKPRDFERRALPIEDQDAVLGNNWRDAVIAKAVGVEDLGARKAEEEETVQAANETAENTGGSAGVKILLAEDNAINALLTRTLLEAEGCMVDVVEDGALAVEAVRNGAYDMIFMDMRMPNMDGLEATRKIRAMGHGADKLPIVALTANAFDDDRNACFDSGMNDFMTKPVAAEELSEMVNIHTGAAQQERMAG